MSHSGRRRCSMDMDLIGRGYSAPAVALSAVLSADGDSAAAERGERTDDLAVAIPPGRRAVRADLEQVFRTAYPRVVAVAARVLGSRDAVEALDERRRVRAALARLPRKQAVALVLRHSGLAYVEVAAALGLSPGSVGTTVRRAESALRKELIRHASPD